jgi:predicted permease
MVEDARELLRGDDQHAFSLLRVLLRLSKDLLRSLPREWLLVIRERRSERAGQDAAPLSCPSQRAGHDVASLSRPSERAGQDAAPPWRLSERAGPHAAPPSRLSEALLQDLAAAARRLLRHPSFALGLILLLGIVLGAATAVSAVIGSYLLRPLPYPEADRIVAVRPGVPVSAAEAADLFEVAVTWDLDVFTLLGEESSELAYGAWVSEDYFELFGMRAARGRLFGADETGPGGSAVAVISHELWQRRWGGDPGVIGRTVRAFTSDRPEDAELFTVVGVLPSGTWHYNRYVEFLAPLRTENPVYVGRLGAGVPPEDAARALEARARPLMESVPEDFRVRLVPLQTEYTAELRPLLSVGAVVVALLLLIAWANAAVLLLIRSQTQERELWVRRALGASRRRLATQLALEALLLAGCAGAVGVIMAGLLLNRLGGALQASLGRPVPGGLEALSLNGYALAAATAATVFTALVFALTPWLGATLRARGNEGAARSARGATAGRGNTRVRDLLVTAELALSIVLLVSGILAVRSARHLAVQELGFDPDGVYVANVQLRARSYPESADRAAFYDRVATAVRDLPMVEAAAVSVLAPFRWGYTPQLAEAEGNAAPGPRVEATRLVVGPEWFETMRIRVLSGIRDGEPSGPGDGEVHGAAARSSDTSSPGGWCSPVRACCWEWPAPSCWAESWPHSSTA